MTTIPLPAEIGGARKAEKERRKVRKAEEEARCSAGSGSLQPPAKSPGEPERIDLEEIAKFERVASRTAEAEDEF